MTVTKLGRYIKKGASGRMYRATKRKNAATTGRKYDPWTFR